MQRLMRRTLVQPAANTVANHSLRPGLEKTAGRHGIGWRIRDRTYESEYLAFRSPVLISSIAPVNKSLEEFCLIDRTC